MLIRSLFFCHCGEIQDFLTCFVSQYIFDSFFAFCCFRKTCLSCFSVRGVSGSIEHCTYAPFALQMKRECINTHHKMPKLLHMIGPSKGKLLMCLDQFYLL